MPNCERESRAFDESPAVLFENAQETLGEMGPVELTLDGDERRLDAVFRIALIFKDDVTVAVTPREGSEGAVLHIRSASRVGKNDLGVNRRRVERFFEQLAVNA